MHKRPSLPGLVLVLILVSMACAMPALPAAPVQLASPAPANTQPAPGSLLFEDDFSERSTGWNRQGAVEGMMDYDAGGYRFLVNSLQANFWSTPQKDYSDVRLEVDEGKLGGPDENRVGLICRYTDNNFYFFIISHDGFYGIGLFTAGEAGTGRMELIGQTEMQSSEKINRGTNINHLRADCSGDSLSFYVNGEPLAQVRDARLTHGDIGLLAGTFSQPGVDVIFDNFVAIQPQVE